jgi:hypothetical protein
MHFSNGWKKIAQELCVGHYTSVSKVVKFHDEVEGVWAERKAEIIKCSPNSCVSAAHSQISG